MNIDTKWKIAINQMSPIPGPTLAQTWEMIHLEYDNKTIRKQLIIKNHRKPQVDAQTTHVSNTYVKPCKFKQDKNNWNQCQTQI